MKNKKQKVYIVVKYDHSRCTIENVYATLRGASKAHKKLDALFRDYPEITFHVLVKSVKGTRDHSCSAGFNYVRIFDGGRIMGIWRLPHRKKIGFLFW